MGPEYMLNAVRNVVPTCTVRPDFIRLAACE